MDDMTISEILDWRDRAVERWNRMNAAPEKGR